MLTSVVLAGRLKGVRVSGGSHNLQARNVRLRDDGDVPGACPQPTIVQYGLSLSSLDSMLLPKDWAVDLKPVHPSGWRWPEIGAPSMPYLRTGW